MIARGIIAQVRTGRPQALSGVVLPSAYHRQSVAGAVPVHPLGLEGDQVGNTRVHGGPDKAIYAYPLSGYDGWRAEFPDLADRFGPGAMGENLVVDGLDERGVCLGDVIQCGTAICQVAQLREPCSTFAAVLGTRRVVKAMTLSGRCGWYFRVLEPGVVAAGDVHAVIERPHPDWPVSRFAPIAAGRAGRLEELDALAGLAALTPRWRQKLAQRAAQLRRGPF